MTYRNDFADDVIEELLAALREGKSMRTICKDKRMPDAATVWRWAKGDDELASNILRAREIGYHARAEQAVEDAKAALDAPLGRLAFDAERWYLGKLSKAFAEKTIIAGDPENPVQTVTRIELIGVAPDGDSTA